MSIYVHLSEFTSNSQRLGLAYRSHLGGRRLETKGESIFQPFRPS